MRVPDSREDARVRAGRHGRWLAAALRDAYDLGWVPEAMIANIAGVHVDREHRAVILVLKSGTRIVDLLDRIDIVGTADDIAVGELVEAVRRRGWASVEVYGMPEFRRAAALLLQGLEPPVAVADSPLGEADLARLEASRRVRPPPAPTARPPAREPGPGPRPRAGAS